MRSLDSICRENDYTAPYFIKVDDEGAKLDVLMGAMALAPKAEVLILEVTFLPKLIGTPDVTKLLNTRPI